MNNRRSSPEIHQTSSSSSAKWIRINSTKPISKLTHRAAGFRQVWANSRIFFTFKRKIFNSRKNVVMRFTRDSSLSMLPFNDLFYEATIGRPLRLQKTDRGNGIIYCAVDWTRLEPMALWGGGGGGSCRRGVEGNGKRKPMWNSETRRPQPLRGTAADRERPTGVKALPPLIFGFVSLSSYKSNGSFLRYWAVNSMKRTPYSRVTLPLLILHILG